MGGLYAIAIGVRRSGQLPALDGAISDAHAFAEWARSCEASYLTTLITDEDPTAPVTVERVKAKISRILNEDIDRLLIFYSGHGISAQSGDYWLLSNYDSESDEAVNLSLSMRNARRLGIGQIGIFSDACRSSLNTAAYVGGRVIFPVPKNPKTLSRYDEFLSTDIGASAQEVSSSDPAKSYGVFSRCLFSALHGFEPDAIEDRGPRQVVTSIKLAIWLEKAVPLQSGKIAGAAVQYPSITPGWHAPDDEYASFTHIQSPNVDESARDIGSLRLLSGGSQKQGISMAERLALRAKAQEKIAESKAARETAILERTNTYISALARDPIDLEPTLTIHGTKIVEVITADGQEAEVYQRQGVSQVRGAGLAQSIVLRTASKLWIPATILPDFNGTLVVGRDGLESMNYSPLGEHLERGSKHQTEATVARWNALLSVGRPIHAEELTDFADAARQVKHVNPAFGILAAYAYERAGRIDELASVAWYLLDCNKSVPFDVWNLLQVYGDPVSQIAAHGPIPTPIFVAGGVPLVTRGWSLIDPDQERFADLTKFKVRLKDSVWTTFDSGTGIEFAQIIANRRI